ncbi:MAG: hypothetical protein ABEJ03_03755 [Candidatus Nanohaloarchaea archaeon]
MTQVDEHQVELDQEIMDDLEEINEIIQRDGEAINAIAEVDNTVDLGRALEKHGVQRSLNKLHSDFQTLRADLEDAISDVEEKREELQDELQLDEKEEEEFGELGSWASTLDEAIEKLASAKSQNSL